MQANSLRKQYRDTLVIATVPRKSAEELICIDYQWHRILSEPSKTTVQSECMNERNIYIGHKVEAFDPTNTNFGTIAGPPESDVSFWECTHDCGKHTAKLHEAVAA